MTPSHLPSFLFFLILSDLSISNLPVPTLASLSISRHFSLSASCNYIHSLDVFKLTCIGEELYLVIFLCQSWHIHRRHYGSAALGSSAPQSPSAVDGGQGHLGQSVFLLCFFYAGWEFTPFWLHLHFLLKLPDAPSKTPIYSEMWCSSETSRLWRHLTEEDRIWILSWSLALCVPLDKLFNFLVLKWRVRIIMLPTLGVIVGLRRG